MAADIVPSLFGLTPEMYQQSQQARADQQALQYAQLTPFQQANYAVGRGANMLGGAIGRGLGGEDPELARITMRQQIAGQINFADPKSIFQGVELLRQANDTQGAMMLADAGRKAESERALAQQRTVEKMTPEERNARAYALSVADAGTPQFNQLYQTTLAGLINKEKPEPTTNEITNARQIALTAGKEGTPEYTAKFNTELERLTTKPELRPVIKEIGVAKTPGQEAVYTYQVGSGAPQQIIYKTVNGQQTIVPYSGGVDRTTAKVSASATSSGAKKGAEAIAELDSKRLNAAQVASGKAVEQAGLLQELLKTPQPISGSGAPARVGALRVFSTFGLTSSKDDEALGNADKFNALAGERVISFIKALGSNPTDTDREFARTIGPALEKGTKTNTDLINFLLERARKVVVDASEMEKHFYENDYSLRGFKSPFLTDIDKPKASNMSAEDLAKAAGGKLVNGKFVKD